MANTPIIILMDDAPIHTEENGYECDDADCICHAEGYAQEAQAEHDETGTHAPNCRCPWCSAEE